MIYFDSAATSFHRPDCVTDAIIDALRSFGNPSRGAHGVSLAASRKVYECREKISTLFGNNNPLYTAFTSNVTEALNTAVSALISPEDHVITTVFEHNSVLRPLYRTGAELTVIGLTDEQDLDYSRIESSIKNNTKAMVCTHASNLTGTLLELSRIGEICKKHNILLIVDAAQSAGVFDIDMEKFNIDVLCFTGHKSLFGPQGTGGLCHDEHLKLSSLKVGGSGSHSFNTTHPDEMPDALEAGTVNSHGIAGLCAGIDFINQTGLETIRNHETRLVNKFYEGVSVIKNIKLYGNYIQKERAPIVTLNIADVDSSQVAARLWEDFGIAIRSGAHCAPLIHEALGTKEQGALRFSFSYFNTFDEIDTALSALKEVASWV